MNNIIKTIAPATCPHCQKEVFVEFSSTSPELISSFKPEDVQKTKAEAIRRIDELTDVDLEIAEETKKWIEDENTIFSENEIDSIVNSVKNK